MWHVQVCCNRAPSATELLIVAALLLLFLLFHVDWRESTCCITCCHFFQSFRWLQHSAAQSTQNMQPSLLQLCSARCASHWR